ncbi:Multidrug resistance protein NorM [Vibrio aerogenes CECT 7868]|uniref:Multidrug resistance protein NorM n=1 Tax=Vibrio aerogenes CECT 7868 TaxID=1216006 RepID=A0A1M5Z720_9VIBR|nr:MATE family efflux transporter [Vibrio aerogenes]SHI20046.1 Multidrug resistance protein NorM [Vibrio aerogenes CECT 7868]
MKKYKTESRKLIQLALPVLIASVAQTSMGFVDTVMAGGYSATDMAAVAVASSIWFPTILFGIGILMVLIPIIAQLNGAGKRNEIPNQVHQGIYIAFALLIPVFAILSQTELILSLMDVDETLAEKTTHYMYMMLIGAPAFLLFQALKSLTDGISMTKAAMCIGFLGLLLNIPLNWIFVYGKFGIPALGGVGCGVATAIVYWFMLILMAICIKISPGLKNYAVFQTFSKPDKTVMLNIFRLGFPVSASIFFEVTLFAVVALLVAPLGTVVVAAHQITMNYSSMLFMLPMSIGAAVSIRVGHSLGEGKDEHAVIASKVGLLIGLACALVTAILTMLFREQITHIYTENSEVIAISVQLLLLSAVYQFADTVQVVSAGALRGYKDMKVMFYCTFIAYWILGLPSGYILAKTDWLTAPLGVQGFWIGFIIGLSAAAVMLGLRLIWIFGQKQTSELNLTATCS